MYPSAFTYHRATSVHDAVTTLAANPDAKLLAGGHSLIPTMKLRLASPPRWSIWAAWRSCGASGAPTGRS